MKLVQVFELVATFQSSTRVQIWSLSMCGRVAHTPRLTVRFFFSSVYHSLWPLFLLVCFRQHHIDIHALQHFRTCTTLSGAKSAAGAILEYGSSATFGTVVLFAALLSETSNSGESLSSFSKTHADRYGSLILARMSWASSNTKGAGTVRGGSMRKAISLADAGTEVQAYVES